MWLLVKNLKDNPELEKKLWRNFSYGRMEDE
jgi:hypothetical protein